MVSPFSLTKAGLHVAAYVFILMPHNLRVTVSFFGKQWAYGRWPESWTEYYVMDRIQYWLSRVFFFPIVAGLGIWSHKLKHRRVLFFADNESIVYVINKKQRKILNCSGCCANLVLICLKNNILFRARHIRGTKNILADHLSRLQIERFKALAPDMNPVPTPLPAHMLPENWDTR